LPRSGSAPADAFGRVADAYERGRPGWPEEALDRAAGELGLAGDATVLDLAAGTGKLTRLLVPRFRRVLAVEPDDEMRTMLERLVSRAEPLAGFAESIPLDDESVDGVFVGEAFHWFDYRRAYAEVQRVLRPGGGVALLWNVPTGPYEPSLPEGAVRAIEAAFERGGRPGGSKYASGMWREPFGELGEARFDHELVLDRDGVVANELSISSIASLPEDARRALAEQLLSVIADVKYHRPLRCDVYWTRFAA
jgi:SAM-dependent methyltransferase